MSMQHQIKTQHAKSAKPVLADLQLQCYTRSGSARCFHAYQVNKQVGVKGACNMQMNYADVKRQHERQASTCCIGDLVAAKAGLVNLRARLN